MQFKKFLYYLVFLLPWFLSGLLFRVDSNYYYALNLPFFAPKPIIFAIVWPILYLLIAYSISHVYKDSTSNYKIYLVVNYLSNELYTFCFFTLKNQFLALVDVIIVLISSMYLHVETRILRKNYSRYLVPYMIWNLFALLLSFSIFVMN